MELERIGTGEIAILDLVVAITHSPNIRVAAGFPLQYVITQSTRDYISEFTADNCLRGSRAQQRSVSGHFRTVPFCAVVEFDELYAATGPSPIGIEFMPDRDGFKCIV